MLNSVKERIQNHKNHIKLGALITGACTISVISYRLGCRYSIDVIDKWLVSASPDLHKQVVDALYKTITKDRAV